MDINNANNETIADQTKERQVYIGIEITREDIPLAEVTSVKVQMVKMQRLLLHLKLEEKE